MDNGTPGNGHFQLRRVERFDDANNSVCPKKDQIGQGGKPHCDIGAIEFSHKDNYSDEKHVQNFP